MQGEDHLAESGCGSWWPDVGDWEMQPWAGQSPDVPVSTGLGETVVLGIH